MKKHLLKTKEEKGAVSLLVTITVLTFMAVLLGAIITVTTLRQAQLKSDVRIQDIYGADVQMVNEIYYEMVSTTKISDVTTVALAKSTNAKAVNTVTTLKDDNNYDVKIPAKFHIASDSATDRDDGIVIEDANGNQFVWIPVDNIANYARTVFTGENIVSNYTETMPSDEQSSVSANKGYYMGRYEAGDSTIPTAAGNTLRSSRTDENILHPLVIQSGYAPYNYIKKGEAKTRAEAMATEQEYTEITGTKLCSSYAWDTAINFIQGKVANYGTSSPQGNYSNVVKSYTDITGTHQEVASGTSAGVIPTGQTTAVCNIYDMGGNVWEWTSETYSDASSSDVDRGGRYANNYNSSSAGIRSYGNDTSVGDYLAFRVTLFL